MTGPRTPRPTPDPTPATTGHAVIDARLTCIEIRLGVLDPSVRRAIGDLIAGQLRIGGIGSRPVDARELALCDGALKIAELAAGLVVSLQPCWQTCSSRTCARNVVAP